MKRLIEEDYKKPFERIKGAVAIYMQKELEYINRFASNQNILEIMMKFLILLKDTQEINPLFCIETSLGKDLKIKMDDPRDKSKSYIIIIFRNVYTQHQDNCNGLIS